MRRAAGAASAALGAYAYRQATANQIHLVWDLDATLICSTHHPALPPHPTEPPHASPPETDAYFDQYDDDLPPPDDRDFPYNTRTYWRPGARAALKIVSAFATMHIYTAAQASYCAHVQRRLEADGLRFASATHRESHSQHDMMREGKDLRLALPEGSLKRALFFDDRVANFAPQPSNGVHVRAFDTAASGWERDVEMARLVGIALLALLAPVDDVRGLLRCFWSAEQTRRFEPSET